ncbi:hypothetical protein B0J14DRAFT_691181 [Halenospora varia]|nr:hypothetical protein B0J14DRAFT_691181 [Halenospora varia]
MASASGQQIRDVSSLETAYQFPTFSPPDINKNTHIIGVCGVNDFNDDSSPIDGDGWFASDMYAFHAVLRNKGFSQKWLACVSPQQLVSKYGEYLHGNPYRTRKVVLEQSMIDQNHFNDFIITQPANLRDTFLEEVRKECDSARLLNHIVVVMIFARGQHTTHGVYLGGNGDQFDIAEVSPQSVLVTPRDFSSVIGTNVQVTVFSEACYSGGWTVQPDVLNITAMTAAGSENESSSWGYSKSIGRHCGSIFASAVIKATEYLADEEFRSAISETDMYNNIDYLAFTKAVQKVLIEDVDRLEVEGLSSHNFCFSAQDDRWRLDYRERSGIPLDQFAGSWDQLRSVAPKPGLIGHDLDRGVSKYGGAPAGIPEPKPLTNPADSLNILPTSLRTRFSTFSFASDYKIYTRYIEGLCKVYFSTHPGRESYPSNMEIHRLCREILDGKTSLGAKLPMTQYEKVRTVLRYRIQLQHTATFYTHVVNLNPPRSCSEIDMDRVSLSNPTENETYGYCLKFILEHQLFFKPTSEQGREFMKPARFLAMAFAKSQKDRKQVDSDLQLLLNFTGKCIKDVADLPKRNPEVRGRREMWKKSMRDLKGRLSPKRKGLIS